MRFIRQLPDADDLQKSYSLTEAEKRNRESCIGIIQSILEGTDRRKLLIIGPCSADREDAVLDYAHRLNRVANDVADVMYIIPRIYTGKSRTKGIGYKGMLHNPVADMEEDMLQGIISARKLHINVIKETGMFPADEMLYTEELYYLGDLLVYMAVGARSVEAQSHRMTASDNAIPVGMKNPMGGSKSALVNSVLAAQASHRMIYRGWEVQTEGNPYAHCVLRGFTNKSGRGYSNYHYEDIKELYDICTLNNVINAGVVIDCNHANSNKEYDEQPRIARDVLNSCCINPKLDEFVKGLMIESYLEDGCQSPGEGVYGCSITDPCLGWSKTESLIYNMAEVLRQRNIPYSCS